MAIEDQNGPDTTATGQVTPVAPDSSSGQSVQTDTKPITQSGQAASTQTQAQAEETFYADFNSLPPEKQEELKPYYKQMQGAFTKKAQEIAKIRQESKQKTQAYDQFMQSPVENILRMAQQYGLQLSPGSGNQAQPAQKQTAVTPDWAPNTWDEVFQKTGEYISPQIQQMIQEMSQNHQRELAELKASIGEYRQEKVSKQLNEIDPEWHQYEDEMRAILEDHPTLAKNISALYRAAVPIEVIQARANQAALKKYEAKTQAAKVESSGHSRQSGPAKPQYKTFEEAFQAAKRELGRK